MIVASAVLVAAWLTTYILLRASFSAGPHFVAHINCLLPLLPNIVVEPEESVEPRWRGVFSFKGIALKSVRWYDSNNNIVSGECFGAGNDSFFQSLVDCGDDAFVPGKEPSISAHSDGEMNEWFCESQLVCRQRASGMVALLQFIVPFFAGFAAFAVLDVRGRKEPYRETLLQESADRETMTGNTA
ncbi:MAG: hypothetical protein JW888_16545 [Pirellulales bacterium]|nr:hypothetical protein [Pirellulales bacterium]